MRVRDLITKLRQFVNGPPPVTCGQCGGAAVATSAGYTRECGHTGELVMHARAKVTGLGQAKGFFKTLVLLLALPQTLDATVVSARVDVRAELATSFVQVIVDDRFAMLRVGGTGAADVLAWVDVQGEHVPLSADEWVCLYECPPKQPEEPPQRLARLEAAP